MRDPAPPARHTRLREWLALSIATCKQSWITLGVPSELANELANDRSIGDVLVAPHANLQVVIGDVGSGKSLAASRLFQHAIDNALQDATKPFPVFVNARDLQHEPITEYIKGQTDGFVQPFHQRTFIIIDGLDEKGVLQANELIVQLHAYVGAYHKSTVLITTRPLPGLKTIDPHTRLSALHDAVAIALIARIAGKPLHPTEVYSWSTSMQDAAQWPLFAVMIGSELRRQGAIHLNQPAELINRLAEQVVERSGHDAKAINSLLQTLAVKSIGTGTRVRKSAITLERANLKLLADSRLVVETEDTLDFSLEILREWYAARALIEEHVSIEDILPASDRWITAFRLVIESENRNARDDLRYTLASLDPGLASLLILEDSTARATNETSDLSLESAQQVGDELWNAMDAWRRGLGDLFQLIGPVSPSGGTATVGVRIDSATVTTSWYEGSTEQHPVVELPGVTNTRLRDLDSGWAILDTETAPLTREWPWIATRRHLVGSLSKTIRTRRLGLPSYNAVRELVWAFSLAAKDQGQFYPRPIRAREVLGIVEEIEKRTTGELVPFPIHRLEVTRDELTLIRDQLTALLQQDEDVVSDPWPRYDHTPSESKRGYRTWDFYSDERLVQRVNAVYPAALQLYTEIVDRWFKGFQERLQFGCLFPVRLEGRLRRSNQPNWEGAPSLSWRARALPKGKTSRVTVEWSSEEFDLLSYWKEEKDNLRRVRPDTDVTPYPIVDNALPTIDSIRPATDLAHAWLIDDLKQLHWTDLISL